MSKFEHIDSGGGMVAEVNAGEQQPNRPKRDRLGRKIDWDTAPRNVEILNSEEAARLRRLREDVLGNNPEEESTPEMVRECGGSTLASSEHPSENQDKILIRPDEGVFGVFDGMGGYKGGERAADLAREAIVEGLRNLPENMDAKAVQAFLSESLLSANNAVRRGRESDRDLRDMGATASLVKLFEENGGKFAMVATMGDSPVFIVRKNGEFVRVGLDDSSLKWENISWDQKRAMDEQLANVRTPEDYNRLSQRGKELFDHRNGINAAIGLDRTVQPNFYQVPVESGDRILIASDGVTDNLTRNEIAMLLRNANGSSPETCKRLVDAARSIADTGHLPGYGENPSSGENIRRKVDDMSAVMIEVGGNETQPRGSRRERNAEEEKEREGERIAAIDSVRSFEDLMSTAQQLGGINLEDIATEINKWRAEAQVAPSWDGLRFKWQRSETPFSKLNTGRGYGLGSAIGFKIFELTRKEWDERKESASIGGRLKKLFRGR